MKPGDGSIFPDAESMEKDYANEQQLGTKTYQEHVDLFINEVPVQLLSFDHYPVIGDSLRPEWYQNLEIFSEAARKANKPFWAFALAVAHGPITAGTKPLKDLPEPIKVLKTEGTGAVVSLMENGLENYIVIVNRDFRNSMKLIIDCGSTPN